MVVSLNNEKLAPKGEEWISILMSSEIEQVVFYGYSIFYCYNSWFYECSSVTILFDSDRLTTLVRKTLRTCHNHDAQHGLYVDRDIFGLFCSHIWFMLFNKSTSTAAFQRAHWYSRSIFSLVSQPNDMDMLLFFSETRDWGIAFVRFRWNFLCLSVLSAFG